MATAQETLNLMMATKQKNLAFFQKYFSNIHDAFYQREFKAAKLNIDPTTARVELLVNGESLYNADVATQAKNEAILFSDFFKPGYTNLPLRHSYPNEFHQGRFFHASIAAFLREAGALQGTARPYEFQHSLPQVVFLGSGVGLHIKELLAKRPIRHCVVIEHNPDMFLASLYLTDWEKIVTPYIEDQTKSFTFSVGDTGQLNEYQRLHNAYASAWNAICVNVPFMPIQTTYYVHREDPFYTKVSERLNKEIEAYINTWGYYDDEINQFNHLLHNLKSKVKVMNKQDFSHIEKPVVVAANGPSLDEYLPILKEHRDKVILIASGSTLHTLLESDIYPDVAVSVESDKATADVYNLYDRDKLAKVSFIGAGQLHPSSFAWFKESLIYIKQETASTSIFGTTENQIAEGTPSATNAAFAIALELKFPNVYLAGADFGFCYGEDTHAKSAFYNESDNEDQFAQFKKQLQKSSYFLENNDHGKIFTTPFYNTCRMFIQKKIIKHIKTTQVKNLSKGASIDFAEFITSTDFIKTLDEKQPNFNIMDNLTKTSTMLADDEIDGGVQKIKIAIQEMTKIIKKHVNEIKPNLDSIEKGVFKINQITIKQVPGSASNINVMLRGTIWFWLYNYYALAKQTNTSDEQLRFITKVWKRHFLNFLKLLPSHIVEYTSLAGEEDPKLLLSIKEPEPDIEKWLLDIESKN